MKTRNCVSKTRKFALKMMDLADKVDEADVKFIFNRSFVRFE